MDGQQMVFDFAAFAPAVRQLPDYIGSCRAPSTRRAYERDWDCFSRWCSARQITALPAVPAAVARYLTDMAQVFRPITLTRRLAAT